MVVPFSALKQLFVQAYIDDIVFNCWSAAEHIDQI